MEEKEFAEMVREEILRIDPEILIEDDLSGFAWAELYRSVQRHASEKSLRNTAIALPLVRKQIFCSGGMRNSPFAGSETKLQHCLGMCRTLIDLDIPLDAEEEDLLLAAALCHVLPESNILCHLAPEAGRGLNPEIFRTIALIRRDDSDSDERQRRYIQRVQENKLALLIRLADRGDLVSQLHSFSGWSARRYIYDTRNFYFPMCIYAKEHYPELIAPVSVLMEKMRYLIEVAEILLGRYEARETELMQEIQELQEENATIKGILRIHRQAAEK